MLMKYTEDDGHVTFTVRTNERHLYISVADNGLVYQIVIKKNL